MHNIVCNTSHFIGKNFKRSNGNYCPTNFKMFVEGESGVTRYILLSTQWRLLDVILPEDEVYLKCHVKRCGFYH